MLPQLRRIECGNDKGNIPKTWKRGCLLDSPVSYAVIWDLGGILELTRGSNAVAL